MKKSCFVDVQKLGQVYMYVDWASYELWKNGIILKIRRSSGKSLYILKVSKWAISKRNLRNFHLTDKKILVITT